MPADEALQKKRLPKRASWAGIAAQQVVQSRPGTVAGIIFPAFFRGLLLYQMTGKNSGFFRTWINAFLCGLTQARQYILFLNKENYALAGG